ncbi:MAG: hypothetical protein ABIL01_25815 [Pseudomonadota bacterium]
MDSLHADSLFELEALLSSYGDEYLFRGQVRAYNSPDGSPLINSSFARMGCVPPLMLKWTHFIGELLRRGGFNTARPDVLNFTQGLLQHYGWRSFFVDLSSSKAVAAWFAANAFTSKRNWQFCENSFEEAVMLGVLAARYDRHEGLGNLYVLSKERLKSCEHTLANLVDDLATDCDTRYAAQRAWLASIFLQQTRLDPSAVVAHITAPASVFQQMAESGGFESSEDLFPGPEKDKTLEHLLALPRMKIDMPGSPFPFYLRSLEIPEYQDSFVKHLPLTTALASRLWMSEVTDNASGELWLRVEEALFHGHTDTNVPLTRVSAYIRENPVTNVEIDGLICHPARPGNQTYEKGISIRHTEDGRYEIGAISIDYLSDRVSGGGVARGFTYDLIDDRLVRVPSTNDCPCGDSERHQMHLQALAILEHVLATGTIKRKGNIVTVSYPAA